MSVRRHLAAPHRRLLHDRVQLFLRVLRRPDRFLFREHPGARQHLDEIRAVLHLEADLLANLVHAVGDPREAIEPEVGGHAVQDRKSTRLNSSHGYISYAVFCLKKKKKKKRIMKTVKR